MRPKEIQKLLACALAHGSGEDELCSVYIEGGPGVGKSSLVYEAARSAGVDFVDFRLTLRDPVDLRGLPFADRKGEAARWLAPAELPRDGKGILMFDDLPTAAPAVQAAAYQIVIWPHRLGEYQLPPGWIVVGAGNRRGEGLYHPIPPALRNRFTYVAMDVHLDDWTAWAITADVDPVVIAFIHWAYGRDQKEGRQHWPLYCFDSETDWTFPTPRGWERVSRKVKAGLEGDVLAEAVAGDVGLATAQEFMAYRRMSSDIPDPREILEGRVYSLDRIDVVYATVVSVAHHAKPHQYDRALDFAIQLSPEFAVLMAQLLAAKDPEALRRARTFDQWIDIFGGLIA